MAIDTPPFPDCFVCRKHRGLESVPGGVIFENAAIYISHAQLWGEETTHYLGHLFIEPKRHVPELSQLGPEEAREIGLYTSLAAKALQDVCGAVHVYSFVIGDHVPHVHVHVIGRYPGAPREYWGPKVDEWPGAPRGGADAIAELAARLRAFFQRAS
jgi:diadenosine tetraphosphate (Ap4A) HIT family hydrolase